MCDKEEKIKVISRRSSQYTTHYVNGCEFRTFGGSEEKSGDESVIVIDFLFRSDIAGEPFEATITDDGYREAHGRKVMIAEESLVGLAVRKPVLRGIAKLILETFPEEVDK